MAKQRIIPIVYKVDYSQVDKSTASVKKAEQATDKLNKEIKETETISSKSFGGLKNAILATGVIGVVGTLAKKIFDLGVAQEQTTIAFNTFLGSAEKGKRLLADLTKFSLVTPFSPDQVNKAARALLAFGVEGNKVIPTLKLLGDVSSGTGKDLAEMAVIFGQIRSTGRLMGQDLLQLINAGFNPLQQISQKTGKSMGDLKKDMEKGLITFDMVEGAFKDATSEGGLFFNLMEKQSQSVGGKISTLGGNFEEMGKKIFAANAGPIADFIDSLVKITAFFAQPDPEPPVYISEEQAKRLKETQKTLDEFGTLQPSYWDRLVVAVQNYYSTKNRLASEDLNLQLAIAKADYDSGIRTEENIKKIRDLSAALGLLPKGTTEDPLPWVTDDKAGKIDKVTVATEKLTAAQIKARNEFMKMMGFKTGAEKFKENQEADEKEAQRQSEAIDREIEQEKRRADVITANNKDMEDEKVRIAEEAAQRRIDIAREEAALKIQAEEAAFEFGVDAIGALLIASTGAFDAENEALQEKYDEQIRLAGDNQAAKEQIELRRETEEKKLRAKQLEDERKQNTRRILIETVLNAVKALGLPPVPGANYIAAAKATAYGLLAAGLSRRYAKGSEVGIDGPGTTKSDSIPAMLSKGETVMSFEQTESSKGILKAIKAKKLNDQMIEKLYSGKRGTDGVAFSDKRIVEAIKGQKQPDVVKIGSYIYDVRTKNRDHKQFIRRKYIS